MAEEIQKNIGVLPPLPPSAIGKEFVNAVPKVILDTARYIRLPDTDFARPYMSVPGGPTFVWPLGIEGFEIQDQAELGIHKYIGDIELDVEVMHRNQATITISGIFPGHTSTEEHACLRTVFQAVQPPGGKVLHLPHVLSQAQFVACQSLNHIRMRRTSGKTLHTRSWSSELELAQTPLARHQSSLLRLARRLLGHQGLGLPCDGYCKYASQDRTDGLWRCAQVDVALQQN
jgi:hypothetical protein